MSFELRWPHAPLHHGCIYEIWTDGWYRFLPSITQVINPKPIRSGNFFDVPGAGVGVALPAPVAGDPEDCRGEASTERPMVRQQPPLPATVPADREKRLSTMREMRMAHAATLDLVEADYVNPTALGGDQVRFGSTGGRGPVPKKIRNDSDSGEPQAFLEEVKAAETEAVTVADLRVDAAPPQSTRRQRTLDVLQSHDFSNGVLWG